VDNSGGGNKKITWAEGVLRLCYGCRYGVAVTYVGLVPTTFSPAQGDSRKISRLAVARTPGHRARIVTLVPRRTRSRAVFLPMPLDPPVIIACVRLVMIRVRSECHRCYRISGISFHRIGMVQFMSLDSRGFLARGTGRVKTRSAARKEAASAGGSTGERSKPGVPGEKKEGSLNSLPC
jgi:hypothetical protein